MIFESIFGVVDIYSFVKNLRGNQQRILLSTMVHVISPLFRVLYRVYAYNMSIHIPMYVVHICATMSKSKLKLKLKLNTTSLLCTLYSVLV